MDSKIAEVVTQPQILILSPCDARDAASVTISTSTASGSRRRPFSMTINYLHQTLSTGLAPSRSSRNPQAFPRTTSVRREGSSRVLTTPHKKASSRDATRPFEHTRPDNPFTKGTNMSHQVPLQKWQLSSAGSFCKGTRYDYFHIFDDFDMFFFL